jgi:hypothetical protein
MLPFPFERAGSTPNFRRTTSKIDVHDPVVAFLRKPLRSLNGRQLHSFGLAENRV